MVLNPRKKQSVSWLPSFCVLVFHLAAVLLLLTHGCRGQVRVVGSSQPVAVTVGDDIILPCHLTPAVDAVGMTFEWARPDLIPRFVQVRHEGRDLPENQHSSYRGRTSLDITKLNHGDISLKLSKVQLSDSGIYRCYFPDLGQDSTVQLVVGSASLPLVSLAGIDRTISGVLLQCESAGWYPEPEVLWFDGEGNLLSSEPTEIGRGSDDLYTVNSRVTAEKKHSNNFTCRIQQNIINQTRETQIYVPDDFFMVPSNCAASVTFNVVLSLILVLAVTFFWRQNQILKKNEKRETEVIHDAIEVQALLEDLDNKKGKLEEELQMSTEKWINMMIDVLNEILMEIEKQKEEYANLSQEADRVADESEKKINLVDKNVTATGNKANGYLALKTIMTEDKWNLEKRKKDHQQLQLNTEKLMHRARHEISKMAESKKELESQLVQMKKTNGGDKKPER